MVIEQNARINCTKTVEIVFLFRCQLFMCCCNKPYILYIIYNNVVMMTKNGTQIEGENEITDEVMGDIYRKVRRGLP